VRRATDRLIHYGTLRISTRNPHINLASSHVLIDYLAQSDFLPRFNATEISFGCVCANLITGKQLELLDPGVFPPVKGFGELGGPKTQCWRELKAGQALSSDQFEVPIFHRL
jgi:hypothetical protein